MKERELFLSALEIEDAVARAEHLRSACAGDAELLARVQSLLASHDGPSEFLNTSAVEQLANDVEPRFHATILQGGNLADEAEAEAARPEDASMHEDDEVALRYLQPSDREDSLGRLGHYEILEMIGRGAFGTVLRAFDNKLQRVVAIKVLAPELAATSPARKRFLREARMSAAVRHENVVSIYAVEDQPIPYIVMEYIPGKTLQQRLGEQGPLELLDTLRLGKQIADGLAAAHAQDLIHRDIKPGNILLEGGLDERVKITDFGLARAADDASMTQSGVIAGTPLYMAPEQALGHKLDQRADLFSFGSVLYQMISGRPPFRASTTLAVLKRVVDDTPRSIQEIIPETPEWVCELISHLHAKDPDERYGTARKVSRLLARCLADVEAGRTPTIPPPGHVVQKAPKEDNTQIAKRPAASMWQHPITKVAAAVLVLLLGFVLVTTAQFFEPETAPDVSGSDAPERTSGKPNPPGSAAHRLTSDEYKWTRPERVVVGGDAERIVTNPFVSATGDELYFASATKANGEDIFVSRRGSDGETWETPERIPGAINGEFGDGAPSLSADGKMLIFHSLRPNGLGESDLWIANRDSVDKPFGEPENMGRTINCELRDVDPDLSSDGLTLTFVSNRPGTLGKWDLWISTRKTINDDFGPPQNLGAAVNSSAWEIAPSLSADGTALLFASNRSGKFRLWLSTRASVEEPFSKAVMLDEGSGKEFESLHPWLSSDASELYFTMQRSGPPTLWRTRRVPKDTPDQQQSLMSVSPEPTERPEPIEWSADAPPLAIAPFDDGQAKQHQKAWAEYLGVPEEKQVLLGNKDKDGLDIKLTLILIPPGEFLMGSSEEEIVKLREQAKANGLELRDFKWIELEGPQRRVRMTRPYYISNTEISNDQFRSFIKATGFETAAEISGQGSWTARQGKMLLDPNTNWRTQHGTDPTSPVTHVNWHDANACCQWLRKQDADLTFALPTEAQWEYACRAGTTTAWSCGDDEHNLKDYAIVNTKWYRWCGTMKPNPFGLYDMHGNVWEWCRDSLENYSTAETVDPIGPSENEKIIRGGSVFGGHDNRWHNSSGCRSAARYEASANHRVLDKGFRVVAEIPEVIRATLEQSTRQSESNE